MDKEPVTYTAPLTPQQASELENVLRRENFQFEQRPYTRAFARKEKLCVAIYEKGPKVVVQGRGTGDFVRFVLEPQILGVARCDYEELYNPDAFEPHFGIDESGKGDFFGPLVIAGVFTDRQLAKKFQEIGVTDSKRISSDARVKTLATAIRQSLAPQDVLLIGPSRYNELYEKFGRNLNRMLAWGHARVIENLAQKRPDCPRALSDKFANVRVLERALMERGRLLQLDQRTKAESDLAVAAASILAREAFINWMRKAAAPRVLPRGASAEVKKVAIEIVLEGGAQALAGLAKMHFKTASEVLQAAGAD